MKDFIIVTCSDNILGLSTDSITVSSKSRNIVFMSVKIIQEQISGKGENEKRC
jgi:hypothetical protein